MKFLIFGLIVLAITGCSVSTPHTVTTTVVTNPILKPSVAQQSFRPPAVPLITNDPYLSIWSEADHLNDANTVHWTHHEESLVSLVRIDGRPYRLMGDDPSSVPPIPQVSLQVTPTRSIYDFENSNVHVTLTFMTADLPHDLDVLSRPLSYITWSVRSVDGKPHTASLYYSTSSELAVNSTDQTVNWNRQTMGPLTALSVGSDIQSLLNPAGDDTRIDWGNAYTVAQTNQTKSAIGGDNELLAGFVGNGALPAKDDTRQHRAVTDDQPVTAFVFDLGSVGVQPIARHVMVGYDEIWSVKFAGTKLRPYWRRNGATPTDLFQAADRDYPAFVTRCTAFDNDLMTDMTKVGGAKYAQIAALALRQSFAANGIAADANKQPLLFAKENNSDGDIATVDVIFPQDPMMILLSPSLAKATIAPVLAYASSPVWKYPNAPHDLGTYPIASANGSAGEEMTVEESGNMLIICDAITQEDGNTKFITPYWKQLQTWANYLAQYGLDPGDQLCTDDFMGHLDHNANLSVKAIVALAAYGDLCKWKGDTANAAKYTALAKVDGRHWVKTADAGDHSLLAFDKPGTWSQKYNLVWDKILGLNVFPASVAQKETAYYKKMMQKYGVPLDSRTHLTKTDWSFWSATLADNQPDFETFISPVYDYLNGTSSRDPLADSYTTDNLNSSGMHARPVVGGLFIKMLSDRSMWKKWSAGDIVKAANWAPMPTRPTYTYVLPNASKDTGVWKYTTTANPPSTDWFKTSFDDSAWKKGEGAFGTWAPDKVPVRTPWKDTPGDIWLRRTIEIPATATGNLVFMVYHDEDVEIYVNGIAASQESGYNSTYDPLDIAPAALALLKPGATVTLALHIHQTTGGQGVDLGLANVVQP